MQRSVSIVVPVYNEEASIDAFFDRVDRLGFGDALLFVDNASTDDTLARIEALPKGRVIHHSTNEGYGSSIRDGFAATDAEYLIVMDADLEWPPEAIPELLQALEQHPVVYCSRFMGATPDMSLIRRAGNRLVSGLYNLLFGQHTTDLCTGGKGLRRSAFPLHELRLDGFESVIEMAAMCSISGARIHDLPVEYTPRARGRSKMRHVPEAARFVRRIVGFWVRCVVLGRPLHRGREKPSP